MKRIHTILSLLVVGFLFSTNLFSQTAGDFQTTQNGAWNNTSTWARYDGSNWITPAPYSPSFADGVITVLGGDTVTITVNDTVDQLTINFGGQITVNIGDTLFVNATTVCNGYLLNNGAVIAQSAALSFGNESTYEHAQDGGNIPNAAWNTGSTCLITGSKSKAPSNANQNFYNFTWNCPAQSTGLNVGWNNITINGNLSILNSNSQQFRMTSSSYTGPVINIMGNLVITGSKSKATTTGSSGADTYTVNSYGNIIVTSGVLYISGGSGGVTTWNVYGDFTVTNGTLQSSNTASKYVFDKKGIQNINLTGVTYTGATTIIVDSASILNVGTSVIGGNGSFILNNGSTIQTGNANGILGNITCSGLYGGGNSFSSGASYIFNGTVPQISGFHALNIGIPSNVTINNSLGLTLDTNATFGNLTLASGQLILGSDTLTVINPITTGDSASYIATSTTGVLKQHVATTQIFYPVGTVATYLPVWITNSGTADNFSVNVSSDTSTNSAVIDKLHTKWNIEEDVVNTPNCDIQFGWLSGSEGSLFSSLKNNNSHIYLLPSFTEAGSGNYSTNFSSEPFTISRSGISSLGSFTVGVISSIPIITTNSISNISITAASSGGDIISNGGDSVLAKGVCWNTTGNPSISNSKTIDGSGNSSFTSILTNLTPGTTYYVSAYATNAVGTGYGNQISFMTDTVATPNATITWALQTDQTYITTGNINGANETMLGLTPAFETPASGSTTPVQKLKPDATTSATAGTGAWPADTSINTKRFVQFSVMPQPNTNMTITSASMMIGAKGTSLLKASLYLSKDSTFNNATFISVDSSLISNSVTPISFYFNATVNSGQVLYFRIYPWSSTGISSTSKYLYLGKVAISGNTISVPVAASATWPLMSNESPNVTGSVTAGVVKYNGDLEHYGYNANGDRIMSLDGSWPIEASPNFTRFAQFSVSPISGGTFYSDSLKFKMINEYSNNLRVAFYYSTDSSFATKKFVADTTVPGNITSYTYNINDTAITGQTIYLRMYPYDVTGDTKYKLIDLSALSIIGNTTGAIINFPSITTAPLTYISTTFATSGGNVTADGGSMVMAKGVCWDTTTAPTILKSHTIDGTGGGAFVSHITGLQIGKTYYVRAYATNIAGTAYDTSLISFMTLDSLVVPTVTTIVVSNILNKSAQSGGTVTLWGGDSVFARGICWNTKGNPTIADTTKAFNGKDIGSFTSTMVGLMPTTSYYVRAFATNSIGTGYGAVDTFMTQATAPPITKVVAKDGSGDYTSVDSAFNAVSDNYTGTWTIYVKKGIYKEKCLLPSTKVNVVLKGESRDSTILTYDDYSGRIVNGVTLGTSTSYSVDIDANDFTAENITFQNTSQAAQAVALESNGDRQSYYNCNLIGFQDTYYARGSAGPGRIYMKNCFIEGSVDFVFGRDIIVFDSCTINENRNNGTLTAANTDANSLFGYVYLNCQITADSIGFDGQPISKFDLGRPWQASPQTVFINCFEPASLDPAGWLSWNVTPALYAEYKCYGPGYVPSSRVSWSSQLTTQQAAEYTIPNIFSQNSNPAFSFNWLPVEPVITEIKSESNKIIPTDYTLYQNFPNPFNPSTIIKYSVPKSQIVILRIYNLLGQVVTTLVNKQQNAGNYEVTFKADNLASGIYFYTLNAGSFNLTKKMILLK